MALLSYGLTLYLAIRLGYYRSAVFVYAYLAVEDGIGLNGRLQSWRLYMIYLHELITAQGVYA